MRLLAATLIGLTLLLAGAVGWWSARAPAAPITVLRAGRPAAHAAPSLTPGGGGLQALADGLMEVAGPPTPEGEAPPPPRYVAPPPDAAMIFRSQVTAVVAAPDGRSYYALLNTGEGSQALRVGQSFLAGWRLEALSLSEAVLARGRERRTIALFNPDRTSPSEALPGAPAPSPPGEAESSRGSGAPDEALS